MASFQLKGCVHSAIAPITQLSAMCQGVAVQCFINLWCMCEGYGGHLLVCSIKYLALRRFSHENEDTQIHYLNIVFVEVMTTSSKMHDTIVHYVSTNHAFLIIVHACSRVSHVQIPIVYYIHVCRHCSYTDHTFKLALTVIYLIQRMLKK